MANNWPVMYGPYKTCIGSSAHIGAFSMQIEYWILTCKALDPMPAISAYQPYFRRRRLPYDVT